jgi:hypothetical protein
MTTHPGGLDCDLDQNSNYPSKEKQDLNKTVLMSKAGTTDLSGTIWIAKRQGLRIVNTFHNNKKMRPARTGNQGCNDHASKT